LSLGRVRSGTISSNDATSSGRAAHLVEAREEIGCSGRLDEHGYVWLDQEKVVNA
jgi:hypothetical protein